MTKKQKKFYEFYKRYCRQIYIFIYHILDCKEDAYELVEDTFYKAYKKFFKISKKNRNFRLLKALAMEAAYMHGHEDKLNYTIENLEKQKELLAKLIEEEKPE